MITLHLDIMLRGQYQFTLHYRYCPAFSLDPDEVSAEVIKKRPTLRNEPFQICF